MNRRFNRAQYEHMLEIAASLMDTSETASEMSQVLGRNQRRTWC
jgi:hypothetical protein